MYRNAHKKICKPFKKHSYLATGGPKVINNVGNDFDGLVWPDSEDDAKQKYDPLKRKIEDALAADYPDE